jgi:hypothetical protein
MRNAMNKSAIILLAILVTSIPASAEQPATTDTTHAQHGAGGSMAAAKDRIGLSATQRQMIAWSIAGLADMQPVPPSFRPSPGTKVPDGLRLSEIPGIVRGVAPPADGYRYAMLDDKDLLLVEPRDGTIADVIHLNRHL